MNFLNHFPGENSENLPYESLDEFDKLKSNPPFPTNFNDESEDENSRDKRDNKAMFSNEGGNLNKMDETIRDTPEEFPENSKFHGFHVLNDLEKTQE